MLTMTHDAHGSWHTSYSYKYVIHTVRWYCPCCWSQKSEAMKIRRCTFLSLPSDGAVPLAFGCRIQTIKIATALLHSASTSDVMSVALYVSIPSRSRVYYLYFVLSDSRSDVSCHVNTLAAHAVLFRRPYPTILL